MHDPSVPFDVAVVGLGAMGSAAARSLARRGQRVVAFDRHTPPHTLGSSHGRSRIIREAYFEHPLYVPLVSLALDQWRALERRSGRRLLCPTGGLMVGPREGTLFAGTQASVQAHDLPHEELTREEIRDRFPAFHPSEGMAGLLEQRAGVLFPEACVATMLAEASAGGAVMRTGEGIEAWRSDGEGVTLQTSSGATVRARRIVLAAGAWLPELLGGLSACGAAHPAGSPALPLPLPLQVERQCVHAFTPIPGGADFAQTPIAIWEYAPGKHFYTFPDLGDGVKIGIHHEGTMVHPDRCDRDAGPEEEARVRALLARYLPDANGALREADVCLYTNTPDGHFILDRHPGDERVVILSACSGHGFKFSIAIGELVADVVLRQESPFDLAPFRLDRPALRYG